MRDLNEFIEENTLFSSEHLHAIAEAGTANAVRIAQGEMGPHEATAEMMAMLALMFAYFAHVERQADAVLDEAASEFNAFIQDGVDRE